MWTSIRWQVPLGSMALGLIQGVPNLGGPIVTTSGLVFIAAATDDKLRASVVRLIPRADYAATRAAAPIHAADSVGAPLPFDRRRAH